MIVSADELRKLLELENSTIIVVVDRIELEHQIYQNFHAYGFPNIVRAESKNHLRELLESVEVLLSQLFTNLKVCLKAQTWDNIIVLVDEAHRTQEGDLGNYMRGALPSLLLRIHRHANRQDKGWWRNLCSVWLSS